MSRTKKILLVRMDKLGDLVLSLPVDQALQGVNCELTWLVAEGAGFIPRQAEPPRKFQDMSKFFSWSQFFKLVSWLRQQNFSSALVLYAPWWVGLALFWARVPVRAGRLSQWHSFLFFNQKIRQSRKHGERHETDENLALINAAFFSNQEIKNVAPLKLRLPSHDVTRWGLQPKSYVVIHPGMAGSALNWPSSHFQDLILKLHLHHTVVITGTEGDRPQVEPLLRLFSNQTNIVFLNEKLNPEDLLTVLGQAKALVAPSTGVLHLAASLGTPCVGLYSPIPVQRPTRWGARGARVVNLMSPATAEEALANPSSAMARLTVDQVEEALKAFDR